MQRTARSGPWLYVPRNDVRMTTRLFCFPYAGGSAAIFREWPREFPESVQVCNVELPGRGRRLFEPPFTSMGPLVEEAARALADYLDRPFAIFGHSLGALVAFELARYLRVACGARPTHLFLSATRAPQTIRPESTKYDLPVATFRTSSAG
jgi:surfactin synthase thioesterase subunit